MTAEQLIRVCLEFDQQVISPRPSEWGRAALMVAELCRRARCDADRSLVGDWRSVDLSSAHRRAPRDLDQPTLDALTKDDVIG